MQITLGLMQKTGMVLRCNGRGDASYDMKDGQHFNKCEDETTGISGQFSDGKSHQLKHLTLTVSSNSLANC